MRETAPANGKSGSLATLFVTLLFVFLFRSFGAEAFSIPTGSAVPTMLIGDHIVVSKYAYGYSGASLAFMPAVLTHELHGRVLAGEPKLGDYVVFVNPVDGQTLVKRFVGMPGDRIQVVHGILHINGKPVKRERVTDFVDREPGASAVRRYHYIETLPNGVRHDILGSPVDTPEDSLSQDNTRVYVVPAGHYFGMGDNRDNSGDSRFPQVGFIPAENIIGRAEFELFSLKDDAPAWQFWKWPVDFRLDRVLKPVH